MAFCAKEEYFSDYSTDDDIPEGDYVDSKGLIVSLYIDVSERATQKAADEQVIQKVPKKTSDEATSEMEFALHESEKCDSDTDDDIPEEAAKATRGESKEHITTQTALHKVGTKEISAAVESVECMLHCIGEEIALHYETLQRNNGDYAGGYDTDEEVDTIEEERVHTFLQGIIDYVETRLCYLKLVDPGSLTFVPQDAVDADIKAMGILKDTLSFLETKQKEWDDGKWDTDNWEQGKHVACPHLYFTSFEYSDNESNRDKKNVTVLRPVTVGGLMSAMHDYTARIKSCTIEANNKATVWCNDNPHEDSLKLPWGDMCRMCDFIQNAAEELHQAAMSIPYYDGEYSLVEVTHTDEEGKQRTKRRQLLLHEIINIERKFTDKLTCFEQLKNESTKQLDEWKKTICTPTNRREKLKELQVYDEFDSMLECLQIEPPSALLCMRRYIQDQRVDLITRKLVELPTSYAISLHKDFIITHAVHFSSGFSKYSVTDWTGNKQHVTIDRLCGP